MSRHNCSSAGKSDSRIIFTSLIVNRTGHWFFQQRFRTGSVNVDETLFVGLDHHGDPLHYRGGTHFRRLGEFRRSVLDPLRIDLEDANSDAAHDDRKSAVSIWETGTSLPFCYQMLITDSTDVAAHWARTAGELLVVSSIGAASGSIGLWRQDAVR
jgi:hypothetical protein